LQFPHAKQITNYIYILYLLKCVVRNNFIPNHVFHKYFEVYILIISTLEEQRIYL